MYLDGASRTLRLQQQHNVMLEDYHFLTFMPSLYRIEVTFSSTEDLFILRTQSFIFNAFMY